MPEVFLLSIPNSLTLSDLWMWICPLEQTKKKEEKERKKERRKCISPLGTHDPSGPISCPL